MKRLLTVGAALLLLSAVVFGIAEDFGHFEGLPVQVSWDRRGRIMVLLANVSYIDSKGNKWTAPKGLKTDGASIPRIFWTLVGGPFEGEYREAALVHDQYCALPKDGGYPNHGGRTWREVHRMFYEACRAAGVGDVQAKILYAAVLIGGPKWGRCSDCPAAWSLEPRVIPPDGRPWPVVEPLLEEKDMQRIRDLAEQIDIDEFEGTIVAGYTRLQDRR